MSDIDYAHELAESHKALNEAGWEIDRLRAENEKLRAELHNANEALTVAYLHGYSTASEQARATAIRETGNE